MINLDLVSLMYHLSIVISNKAALVRIFIALRCEKVYNNINLTEICRHEIYA
jgi:hypothetical protein